MFDGEKEVGKYCFRNQTMDVSETVTVGQELKIQFRSTYMLGKAGFEVQVDLGKTSIYSVCILVVVVVQGQGGIFALDVGHTVGPLNYSRCDINTDFPAL